MSCRVGAQFPMCWRGVRRSRMTSRCSKWSGGSGSRVLGNDDSPSSFRGPPVISRGSPCHSEGSPCHSERSEESSGSGERARGDSIACAAGLSLGMLHNDQPSDTSLLARLAADDASALDALLVRHWSPLTTFLARLTGSVDAAEDAAQETFCRLWERRRSWRPAGSVVGLLYRLARHIEIGRASCRDRGEREGVAAGGETGNRGADGEEGG